MAKPIIGAQLFTLREHTKTIPEIDNVFGRVKEMGYTSVQLSGGGFGAADPKEVGKLLGDHGLICASTHMGWPRFQNELDAVIEEHKIYKCAHPAVGGLPQEYRSADGIKRFADELAPIAERLAAEGMDFSYHNHNQEFVKYGDKVWLQHAFDEIPGLNFEIDVYWVQAGGASPVAWLKKVAGRCPVIHYKDMAMTPKREQIFAPIGEGNLDWAGIIEASEASGAIYALVEQDRCYDQDPFECLAISCRNLKAMGLG